MAYKEKIINKLRKGYSPIELSPKDELTSIYKQAFKPLIDKKSLDIFFELYDTNEVILRAWGFLGLYHILKENIIRDEEKILKVQKIILEVLGDKREINYYGGMTEVRTSLREHHVRRICELDTSLIFEPVFEYCKSFEGEVDEVIVDLLENVLSKVSNPALESLFLNHAKNISKGEFSMKIHIVNAFENLGQIIELKEIDVITELFKFFLNEIKQSKNNDQENLNKKKQLHKDILRVAAIIDLDLEQETLEFVDSLKYPYNSLNQIAKKYKTNKEFKSILLRKLKESDNPRFITDILKAILVLKENIENWKDLVIEQVKKYQLTDGALITEMQESNLINVDMILSFLSKGENWYLDFIREYLIYHPEVLDEWQGLRDEFIRVLELFDFPEQSSDNYQIIKDKKELILKLIIDLKREDLVKYCLENFKNLDDEKLKKLALFPILKFGEESLLVKLKELMKNNEETAKFVRRFWSRLERNDWRFFY
ncbi:MAG: hypothetical protein ACFFAK_05945 [Promethearchaeota archaeon]